MIYVDSRTGSSGLAPLLRGRGLPVTLCAIAFGDVSFCGVGPEGVPVTVGVEVKTIHDVLQCVTDGRFAGHQLPGLVQKYEQPWLLIEGLWRPNAQSGVLEIRSQKGRGKGRWYPAEIGKRGFMYRDLLTWLFTMGTKAGLSIARVQDWGEATIWLTTLYSWWTSKTYDGHKSHLALNEAGRNQFWDRSAPANRGLHDRALFIRPTLSRLVGKEIPGIGFEKSALLAHRFTSVHSLVNASEKELAEVVGQAAAKKMYQAIRRENYR